MFIDWQCGFDEVFAYRFEPWAHDSGDADTVATFYCGEEQKFP